jgi:transcription elongation factor GreA
MVQTLPRRTRTASRVRERADLGSVVTLHDVGDNSEWTVTIVETEYADPDADRISDECPLGAAVLGRAAGDLVKIEAPSGLLRYRVLSVRTAGRNGA